MVEPTKKKQGFWARFVAFANWRLSETIVLLSVFLIGVLILSVHLSTWGKTVRVESKTLRSAICRVEGLAIRSRVDETGVAKYRPELKIVYDYGGKSYELWTFDRSTLTESHGFFYDERGAREALLPYKKGKYYQCWIRADDPRQAFVVKNSTVWGWIFLIIPVSLIFFGGGWLVVRFWQRSRSKEALANSKRKETSYPNVPALECDRGQSLAIRLSPDVKSSFSFGASALGTCLWNLASWVGFFYVLASSKTSADYWSALFFGALFCGIGLLFACRLWGQYRVERVVGSTALEISQNPVVPGRRVKLCLFLKGRIEAKRLDVFAKCEEVARFVQGTNAICSRHETFSRTVFTKYDLNVPARGEEFERFTMQLPIGVIHSFTADHNEINWRLVVQMEFADGGVFKRDFAFVVAPFIPERE